MRIVCNMDTGKGEPACPHVQQGKTPVFKPKPRTVHVTWVTGRTETETRNESADEDEASDMHVVWTKFNLDKYTHAVEL